MTPEQFCYWLQGHLAIQRGLGGPIVLTDREVQVIEQHLELALKKPSVKTPEQSCPILINRTFYSD